jgi:hypothetical protein
MLKRLIHGNPSPVDKWQWDICSYVNVSTTDPAWAILGLNSVLRVRSQSQAMARQIKKKEFNKRKDHKNKI